MPSLTEYRKHTVRGSIAGFCLVAALFLHAPSATAEDAPTPERMALAQGRAELRWQLLFARMPTRFDRAAWKEPTEQDYERANSLVDLIAYELWAFNSNDDAIFSYLNDVLIPFVTSHRKEYLCNLTEMYAASGISTSEMGKMDDHGLMILLEYAYLFGNTASELKSRGLDVSPDHAEYARAEAASHLRTNGWNSLTPRTPPKLNCDQL